MRMEAEIISKEFIKPSSPTPHHNKTYTLSLFDQVVAPIFVPLVLYFPKPESTDSIAEITEKLKHSLSSTLSHFYPLAGRIKDSFSIDCNDEGIPFTVAKFPYCLRDFLKNPDSSATRSHIPTVLTWAEPGPGSEVAMVQLNHFNCGGAAIGILIHHKLADGLSTGTFMKSWASACRGNAGEALLPDYTALSLFPANKSMQREQHIFSAMKRYFGFGKTVMRRYVFDAASISRLRACISEPEGQKRQPTRVETVSAFLWKCFMAASASASSGRSRQTSLVSHVVNMRRKREPPLGEQTFGNYAWLVPASSDDAENDNNDLKQLFNKVRDAISEVDAEFVKRMEGDAGFTGYCTNLEKSMNGFPEKADYLSISSWCNFGIYEVDFGWGRPVWMSRCDGGSEEEWPYVNVVWLNDTREGGGIEAWVTLEQSYFEEFDKVEEMGDYALIDPSPLEISSIKEPSSLTKNGNGMVKS